MDSPMMKLMKMPEAEATFGRFASASHIYEPPKAEIDLFTNGQKENIDLILTGFPVLFGQAGSGKSNSVGRIVEQLLGYKIQVFLSDITGEHEGIVDMFPSQFERLDLNGDPLQAIERFFKNDKSLYIDLSTYDRMTYLKYYDTFLSGFYEMKAKTNEDIRRAHVFIFEEAHNLIPEYAPATDKDTLAVLVRVREHIKRYGLQGRKYGMSCILITQRPSMCSKDIISQSRCRFMLKVFEKNDVDTYGAMIPGTIRRELVKTLNQMKPGECIFVADGRVSMRRFKLKKSKDKGRTPGYAATMGWKASAIVD